jgi:hypothetical protein
MVHQGLQKTPPQPGLSLDAPIAGSVFDQQASNGKSQIQDIFSGDASKKESAGLDSAVATERKSSDHFRVVDAGVGRAQFDNVDTTVTPAVADGTVETWSKMQFKNPDGTWVYPEPHNTIHFHMTATKDGTGKWTVQTFDWDFPTGDGP